MVLAVLKIGFLLGAVAMVGFSVISLLGTRKFMARTVSAEGTILQITRAPSISGDSSGIIYRRVYLHIAFNSASGEEIRFRSVPVYARNGHRTGDVVDVVYDPVGVGEPRLSSFRGIWGRSIDIAMYGVNFVGAWFVLSVIGFFPFAR